MRKLLFTLLDLISANAMVHAATPPGVGKRRGHMEDAATQKPIANAAVKLTHSAEESATTTSNAKGRFMAGRLHP